MKELLNYELSLLREKLTQAKANDNKDDMQAIATRILQISARLQQINTRNWYGRR
jgi:hypothetical protein